MPSQHNHDTAAYAPRCGGNAVSKKTEKPIANKPMKTTEFIKMRKSAKILSFAEMVRWHDKQCLTDAPSLRWLKNFVELSHPTGSTVITAVRDGYEARNRKTYRYKIYEGAAIRRDLDKHDKVLYTIPESVKPKPE